MKLECKYCKKLFVQNINNQEFCCSRHYRRWRVKNIPKYRDAHRKESQRYRIEHAEWYREYQTQYRIKNNIIL